MSEAQLPFRDRREAGRVLAQRLQHYHDVLVLALPRGGVAVGFEIATALHAPLDVLVVRKLGFPGHAEYAMGAIASGGVRVMNDVPGLWLAAPLVEAVAKREQLELERRERLYRGDWPALQVAGRTVILVDDGLATGATMRAAALAVRQLGPAHLCIAAPVGAAQACEALRPLADEVVCAATPSPFRAVGLWYRDFPQSTDDEVRELLAEAQRQHEHALH